MSSKRATMADLRREAIKEFNNRTELYWDVMADLPDMGSPYLAKIIQKELMRRIACTNSSFEHLIESIDE